MACDPAVLIDQAKCINACIPPGMMTAVNTSLLCQISNSGIAAFPSGLIHYWTLNEASGNSRADTIGTLLLTEDNGAVPNGVGKHLNAADFSPDGLISLRTTVAISLPASFAISVWFFLNSTPATNRLILEFDDNVNTPLLLELLSNGHLRFGLDWNIAAPISSFDYGVISLSAWHLAVINVSATSYGISVDGGAFNNTVYSHAAWNPVEISLSSNGVLGEDGIDGKIDEFGMYNRVLLQQEAINLWNNGAGLFP
jgi:hypothetical protein